MTHLERIAARADGTVDPVALLGRYAGAPAGASAPSRVGAAGADGWVRAMMLTTLDGHATGTDGRSAGIGSAADRAVFEVTRAVSDVVVVGAGTVREERYTRLATPPVLRDARLEAGRAPHPVLAIVTASGEVPGRALESLADVGDVVVVAATRTDTRRLVGRLGADRVLVAGDDEVEPEQALAALRGLGLRDVVCEGGPRLLRDWLGAGVVDELCLTVRPVLLGGTGPRIVEGDRLPEQARGWSVAQVLQVADDLMLRVLAPGR